MVDSLQRLLTKSIRLRRHLHAFLKYGTPYKACNIVLVETERILHRERLKGRPYFAFIDPSTFCGLKCPGCPTGKGDSWLPRTAMPLENYREIINQMSPYVVKIALYNWGDPFLNTNICTMVKYAHEKRIATAISSTMNVLPREGAEELVRSGLDDLIVSCDGLTQETYQKYRVNGKLDRVLENVRAVQRAKAKLKSKSPHLEFQFLTFRHNEHEVPRVREFAQGLGIDCVRIVEGYVEAGAQETPPAARPDESHADNGAGSTGERRSKKRRRGCFYPWRVIAINANGQVDPCCVFPNKQAFGNVPETAVAEVWNNENYRTARRIIAGKPVLSKATKIICRGCKLLLDAY